MDFRYFNYISLSEPYYVNNTVNIKQNEFYTNNVRDDYQKVKDNHWIYYIFNYDEMPEQGWKIHISALPKNAQEILNVVSKILFEKSISFKFVRNYQELKKKNSKYADRTASGKFITIYPMDSEQFVEILEDLRIALKTFPLGPYILTDKRWYESNVYFRYGAFKNMFFYKGTEKKYVIKYPNGKLIEDIRKPYYILPDFIEEPLEIQKMDSILDTFKTENSKLENYKIDKVLHFSNGGGVYQAKSKEGKRCILKEGRLGSGLDSLENDAFERINNEAKCLNILSELDCVVDIYDYFKEWEHNFIVEEYIEGLTLGEWIVNNYPFYTNKNVKYKEVSINILKQLYKAIQSVNLKGIGLGDLSLNNIMINNENYIKLIDLEISGDLSDNNKPIPLNTLGFSGSKKMNRKQSDWFALLRIARFLFLPVGPVQDISSGIIPVHDQIIKSHFGSEPIKMIRKIEGKCRELKTSPISNFVTYDYKENSVENLDIIFEKLLFHLSKSISEDKKMIYGDIRQYEIQSGEKNIMTGDYGLVFAFNRVDVKNQKLSSWSKNQKLFDIIKMDESLFLGKGGIATVLWENSEQNRAKKILETFKNYKNSNDVTITSGLAGIGLLFIGFSYEKEFNDLINKAIEIGERLKVLLEKNVDVKTYDKDITNIGLMNGWSGVSLFFSALYKKTHEKKWLALSEQALEKDLKKGCFDYKESIYHLDDEYRKMPYLDGGSAGLGLAILELNILKDKNNYSKELECIKNLINCKSYYNAGLFRGTLGIIDVTRAIDKYNNQNFNSGLLENLKIHWIFSENGILMPGEFGYRLSDDLFSGSTGALLVIRALQTNESFLWMPIPNIKKVFASNKF